MNTLCSHGLEMEDRSHYLRHCHHFSHHRIDLMNIGKLVFDKCESLSDNNKKDVLLSGDTRFDENQNKFIVEPTITYVKTSERFSGSLFE